MKAIWDGFEDWADVQHQYETDAPEPDVVILAAYWTGSYAGASWIVGIRGNKVISVHGSHCSCYGFEGQYDEEEYDSIAEAVAVFSKFDNRDEYEYRDKVIAMLLERDK